VVKNLNAVDSRTPNCPKCGATRTKRLIYGLIHYETLLELGPTEPDFEFGWVTEKMRAWHCSECLHQWGEPAVRQAETAVS
jgi:ribosomal protein L37AE/L43A